MLERIPFELAPNEGNLIMLWTLVIVLLVLWIAGLITSTTFGGIIHVLLVLAIIMVVISLIQGRRVVA